MSLKARFALRAAIGLPLIAAVLFGTAGTLHFWQAWVSLAAIAACPTILLTYFLRDDPQLLERRLARKETRPKQKRWQWLFIPLYVLLFLIPGFDRRFGWSQELLGGVPAWLSIVAQAALLVSWLAIFQVFRYNSFAGAVIQVEADQKVISDGPYRVVRHPMYSAMILMFFALPPAFGSFVAWPLALPLAALMVYRLLDEERALRKDLRGYEDYCRVTHFRLLPHAW